MFMAYGGDIQPSSGLSNSAFDVKVYVEGKVAVYVSHGDPTDGEQQAPKSELTYLLLDRSSNILSRRYLVVNFGAAGDSLTTGDVVLARLALQVPVDLAAHLGFLFAEGNGTLTRRRQLNEEQKTVRRMILDFHNTRRCTECGMILPLNISGVDEWLFDNPNIMGNLERWYKMCTYDQITFRRANNTIVEMDVPCNGTTVDGPFDFKNGRGNRRNGMNEALALPHLAEAFLQKNHPDLSRRWGQYRTIYIFPFDWYTSYVGWRGLDKSKTSISMSTLVQELGHNIGLAHSSRWVLYGGMRHWWEYGDQTCPMGYGTSTDEQTKLICVNAAQSYKAGWSRPIPGGHISALTDLKPGVHQEFSLPSMHNSKNNMLRIVVDAINPVIDESITGFQHAIFVSYRVRQTSNGSYDSGLADYQDRRVCPTSATTLTTTTASTDATDTATTHTPAPITTTPASTDATDTTTARTPAPITTTPASTDATDTTTARTPAPITKTPASTDATDTTTTRTPAPINQTPSSTDATDTTTSRTPALITTTPASTDATDTTTARTPAPITTIHAFTDATDTTTTRTTTSRATDTTDSTDTTTPSTTNAAQAPAAATSLITAPVANNFTDTITGHSTTPAATHTHTPSTTLITTFTLSPATNTSTTCTIPYHAATCQNTIPATSIATGPTTSRTTTAAAIQLPLAATTLTTAFPAARSAAPITTSPTANSFPNTISTSLSIIITSGATPTTTAPVKVSNTHVATLAHTSSATRTKTVSPTCTVTPVTKIAPGQNSSPSVVITTPATYCAPTTTSKALHPYSANSTTTAATTAATHVQP
ncbi:hypothetical protein PLESTB_001588300 [Pleodorina starrii]|uniref:Peptidase M11 gametolysin domain-containing protein n=1 Tax=Pleodorina starrii TaxID=330485 RepID=A0A9W6BXT8_9CHLO|nr:hypothetical protein PLESTB_001588300 [Pleodorina starrii]